MLIMSAGLVALTCAKPSYSIASACNRKIWAAGGTVIHPHAGTLALALLSVLNRCFHAEPVDRTASLLGKLRKQPPIPARVVCPP